VAALVVWDESVDAAALDAPAVLLALAHAPGADRWRQDSWPPGLPQ
jgi:hypothetical protein